MRLFESMGQLARWWVFDGGHQATDKPIPFRRAQLSTTRGSSLAVSNVQFVAGKNFAFGFHSEHDDDRLKAESLFSLPERKEGWCTYFGLCSLPGCQWQGLLWDPRTVIL